MDWLQIVVLALIQGITEFLPVSSSAHLILPAQLTDWPDQGLAFDIALHMGSLLAVMAYLRQDIGQLAHGGWVLVSQRRIDASGELLLKVGAAVVPIVIVGFALKDWVESDLRSVAVIAGATIGFGLLLWFADRRDGNAETVSWKHALVIGAFQVLALVPGTSRSGITMTAALLLGISRTVGVRFSFVLSIPTIASAALLSTLDLVDRPEPAHWGALGAGFALAGLSAYACIHYFLQFIESTGMTPYVIYRLLLGVALLVWFV